MAALKKNEQDARRSLPKIEARGSKLYWWEDFYHWVLTLTWPRFFLALALSYVVVNAFFAAIYELSPGCIDHATGFWDLFFFSVQTLSTVGYGAMAPITRYGNVIVSLESFLGLTTTALVTGFTFARFSRPRARILFSDAIVINTRNGVRHMQFRLANWRRNQIVETTIRVFVLVLEKSAEGETMRRPLFLKLVRDTNPMFLLSWLVMHEIDESSPFYGEGAMEKLRSQEAEIFLNVTGLDETIAQPVHARFRYSLDAIVENARFVNVISTENGTRIIDYDKFHDIERLP